MEYFIQSFLFVSIVLCIVYFVLIASYCYGWIKIKQPTLKSNVPHTKVSVIVAVRNEEGNIEQCINAIIQQSYPSDLYELIIVDDASEDSTNFKIQQYCNANKNLTLISLKPDTHALGKKNALAIGIKESDSELIVTTDADCVMDKNWLVTIVSYYEETCPKMIVGPVVFYDEKNSFEKMQTLEFMSLVVSGGASLYFNKAILCNGANLAYPKKVFEEVNGFDDISQIASGDDVLLMYKIENKYPGQIKFLKHQEALVYTKAKNTLSEFINQRKRWASKGFSSLNDESKTVAVIVYVFNLLLFGLMIMSINSAFLFENFLILLAVKCVIDFLLLFLASSFFNKRKLLVYLLPQEFLYIFYVVVTGMIGSVSKHEWKGRKNKD